MKEKSRGTSEGASAGRDQYATVQDLQRQLAYQEDELHRLKTELARARDALSRETAERRRIEDALRESEDHFRLIVEHSHDVVYSVAPDGIVQYMSPGFSHYGYEPEEIISKHFIGFVAPEQREQVIESFETGTKAGTSYPTVFQWLKKDGSRVWVEVIGNTIFDDSGEPVQQVGVIRDIGERKLQEERMQSLELLLESLDAECFIKDRDGIYQYINQAYERQFGVKREDVVGKDDDFVFGEETGAMLRENDQRIMVSGKTESVEETTYLQDEKHVVYVTVKTPITDGDGNVIGICGVGIDITSQKRVEDELRESEEQYRDLVERISDVIYSIDATGELTYVSPAIEPFLGYSPAEMVGRPFSDFIAPEDLRRSGQSFQQLAGGAFLGPNEYRVVTKEGEVRWMRASSQPIIDGEQASGVRGVLTDITSRVRAEEQERLAAAAAERERLSRDLHDSVTQTLFSIAAIAEVLPDVWDHDPDKARRGLAELQQQTQGALAEMRSLLLAWRPESQPAQSLGDLIRDLGEEAAARTQMPVTTTVMGEIHPPDEVRDALYRIAQEGLNNVAKHAGASRATVRLQRTDKGLRLSISDDGRGFDPERTSPYQMGLGIMRERALAVGADLTIVSEPGVGTEIVVVWKESGRAIDD